MSETERLWNHSKNWEEKDIKFQNHSVIGKNLCNLLTSQSKVCVSKPFIFSLLLVSSPSPSRWKGTMGSWLGKPGHVSSMALPTSSGCLTDFRQTQYWSIFPHFPEKEEWSSRVHLPQKVASRYHQVLLAGGASNVRGVRSHSHVWHHRNGVNLYT